MEILDIVYSQEIEVEPFQLYINEDKTIYPLANTIINPRTGKNYIDTYDYFRVGESGGFLMNINFKFINTHLFREVAIYQEKFKEYIDEPFESSGYDKFRLREEHRRTYGYEQPCRLMKDGTITSLHISGSFYNFLNYGRIRKLDRLSIRKGLTPRKEEGHPEFFDSQFWWHAVKEFAERNGFNRIALKSRRKGASFMEGTDSSNTINLQPNTVAIHAAWDSKFVTKAGAITRMAEKSLKWYESHTPFKRCAIDDTFTSKGFVSKVIEEIVLGYKNKNGTVEGWQSTLFSLSTSNSPDNAVGKDAVQIKCDELNSFPNFSDFMKMTNPTTTTGAFKTGFISAFGTGGTKDSNWQEFQKHFYDTEMYDFMPFENVWDDNSRHEKVGYFYPYWWGLEGEDELGNWSIDLDGNSNYEIAIKIAMKQRQGKLKSKGAGADYFDYVSQFCNKPSEAFTGGTEKFFTSIELKNHIKDLLNNKEYRFYRDGTLEVVKGDLRFVSNNELLSRGMKEHIHPFIEDYPLKENFDKRGCWRIYYSPFKDTQTGIISDNLYFSVYDPVGVSKELQDVTDKNSLACTQIWMYPNNISNSSGRILVAEWIGRTNGTREDDYEVIKGCDYYNAKCLAEMDRGTMKATCIELGRLKLLLPDPTEITTSRSIKTSGNRSYGMIIGTSARKNDGLLYLKNLMYLPISSTDNNLTTKLFNFWFSIGLLLELDKFNNKGNYDRISCGILAAYQINKYVTLRMQPKDSVKKGKSLNDRLNKKR